MLRPGTIGIVIDDYTFNFFEKPIEKATGDGHHTFNYIGGGYITESHLGSGVTKQHISKYFDGKSAVLLLEPRNDSFDDNVVDTVVSRWCSEIGKGYDKINILAQKWRLFRRFVSDEKRICSEHTAYGYQPFYKFMDRMVHQVTPNTVLKDSIYCNFKKFKPIWLWEAQHEFSKKS